MKVLVNEDGRFLRFAPVHVRPDGRVEPAPKAMNVSCRVVAGFWESPWPGVCGIELDSRSCPHDDFPAPNVLFVRARESEIRGALGLVSECASKTLPPAKAVTK